MGSLFAFLSRQAPKTPLQMIGLALALCGACMAFWFGSTLSNRPTESMIYGGVLALVSLAAYFLPDESRRLRLEGRNADAEIAMLFFAICAAANVMGAFSFSATNKMASSTDASVVNANYSGLEKNITDLEDKIAFFEARQKTLGEANPWAASTTPDAIQALITSMEGDKLYARSKSCAKVTLTDSRAFCDKYAEAKAHLSVIEEANGIPKQIEATRVGLIKARADLAASNKIVASADVSSNILAAAFTFNRTPGADSIFWTTLLTSLLFGFLAEVLPGYLKRLGSQETARAAPKPATVGSYYSQQPAAPTETKIVTNHTTSILDPLFKITAPFARAA